MGRRATHPETALSGRLFYLVGASGAGKDSLLTAVREDLPADAPLAFAHRYITRPANSGGENHVALSEAEFQQRLKHDLFAMHWQSHGLHYGIGREIESWLQAGLEVVVNGSRGYLAEARLRFPRLCAVHLRVDPVLLRERLRARGRESDAAIELRLAQAAELDRTLAGLPLQVIDNNGTLAEAVAQLRELLLNRPA